MSPVYIECADEIASAYYLWLLHQGWWQPAHDGFSHAMHRARRLYACLTEGRDRTKGITPLASREHRR